MQNLKKPIDIDQLMRSVSAKVGRFKARSAGSSVARLATPPESASDAAEPVLSAWSPLAISLPREPEAERLVPIKSEYSLAELCSFHGNEFIANAYRGLLRREPDVAGYEYLTNLLNSGQASKVEILGRMRFSTEGKASAVPVKGLLPRFLLQRAYRIPVVGHILALVKHAARFPVIVRQREQFESSVLHQQREHARHLNGLATQIEAIFAELQQSLGKRDGDFARLMTRLIQTRGDTAVLVGVINDVKDVDRRLNALNRQLDELAELGELALSRTMEVKVDSARLRDIPQQLAQVERKAAELGNFLALKADAEELSRLARSIAEVERGKVDVTRLDELSASLSDMNEVLLSLKQELASKADVAHVDQLGSSLSDASQRVEQLVEAIRQQLAAKAESGQLEVLRMSLSTVMKSMESKADTESIERVVRGLAEMDNRKAESQQVQHLAASITEELAKRAMVVQVEELLTRHLEATFAIGQALEVKVDNERLTHLTNHLIDLIQRKAEAAQVSKLQDQLENSLAKHALAADVDAALKGKADIDRVVQLAKSVHDLQLEKADGPAVTLITSELKEQVSQRALASWVDEIAAQSDARITGLSKQLEAKADLAPTMQEYAEIKREVLDHKRNILDQHRRLALLLEEARKRLPAPISEQQIEKIVSEEDHLLDAFYASFEDRFRGTREDVKKRVSVYLPFIAKAKVGTRGAPILDIGCGRGEWLEVLKENDMVASGVDINRAMVTQCHDLGLDVVEDDAIAHLRTLKSNSVGAVTATHLIEHIPFKRRVALWDEILRVLVPNGVAIFETPNPENLIVGACNFYYDPTHISPLPPEPTRYVLEARGFGRVDIIRLHPKAELKATEPETPLLQLLNGLVFGPQDYALIAFKT